VKNTIPSTRHFDRRRFLHTSAVAIAGALSGPQMTAQSTGAPGALRRTDVITRENQKAGDDWQLTRVRVDRVEGRMGFRSPWIEGYCSQQSVEAGDSLELMVSTDPARAFTVEIFRMGYYGGKGARRVSTLGPLRGKKQPAPEVGKGRVRECRWESSARIVIPPDWLSGVYLGRLTTVPESARDPYWQSYVVFIVRDRRPADILFQCSDSTWQAYNRWPDNYSLYTTPKGSWEAEMAVSFDRPYGRYPQIYENPQSVGSGEFLLWEYPLCYWLEQQGYDVSYCSNRDLLAPDRALKCRVMLSQGHDEYWDLRQYHSVRKLIDEGVSVLFLAGNSVCGVTPFSPSAGGQPDRILTLMGRYGGKKSLEISNRSRPEGRKLGPYPVEDAPDEAALIGARNITPINGGADWIVAKPEHWMFEGTGMKKGDLVPGLVGWEFHGDPATFLPGLEIVAEGTAFSGGVRPVQWTATIYPGPKGNFVFNAATIWWAQGLSSPPGHMLPWSHFNRPHGPDERVQRITNNLLRRALGGKLRS
jgi:hypothetical protein